ncbi:hypothetical protein [Ohtaekwangia koreensis]|uniref:Uncharacterized protein n=1 Tax=Ohtaekwangia koreensis TaxID=688867 RepID=A0A1T5M953_9BACT|nr:hypothetical protein [Ohtaekwangia koreensis]SKC84399.1 hypothetical protein SAMN05660236_4771 [Ohtaekwangia koreensis]
MEELRTSIFEKNKEKSKKRILYNIGIFAAIGAIWVLYFIGLPIIGLKTCIGFTVVMIGIKLYDDKYMGISAYGERKANLVIAEEYLEIRDVKISYTDLTDLVIYVDEYLGMPKEIFGIHHGGNNKIEFNHKGRLVSINYVIKNKQDYDRVLRQVTGIEKNPSLKRNLKKLD